MAIDISDFHHRVAFQQTLKVPYWVKIPHRAHWWLGAGKKHRTQVVQGIKARKTRGCDLAFEMVSEVSVEGEIPGGGLDRVTIRVASIVPFLVMKGMALEDRLKEKDARDIYYCLLRKTGACMSNKLFPLD